MTIQSFKQNQLQLYWKSLQIYYKEIQARNTSWELLKE